MDAPAAQSVSYLLVTATGQRALLDPVLLQQPAFLIGSDPRSHLQLAGPDIAPTHAVITARAGALAIAPRYPALLVQVNGKATRGTVLQAGDTVEVGGFSLRFGQEGMAPPVSSLPQVRIAPASITPVATTAPRLTARPALAVAAPAVTVSAPADVYFPTAKAPSGGGISGAFLGVLTVLGIVLALGFVLAQNSPGLLTTALAGEAAANPFAYNDGNITVLMFDAEW